ncbi:Metabotropic glutamate receptor 8, partial [Durusdinium trenchii]
MKFFRPNSPTESLVRVKARILITGSVRDAEALASLEVFQMLVQKLMQRECTVVRSASQLMAYRPWAYYLVVLLSKGILHDP